MSSAIRCISLGDVNCYLVGAGKGFVLIDTGVASKRAELERELASTGCGPGDLKLIILTHGDSDHADNCVYLREKYGARIAMHRDDVGMVEHGDMSWNRKAKPDLTSGLGRVIMLVSKVMQLFGGPGRFDKFQPDLTVEDGDSLSGYGLEAAVLHLPGHSKGSLGVLTAGGDLFCGDLLYNFGKPGAVFIDDLADFKASLGKLKGLTVRTVYPGHGKPFPMERFTSVG